MPWSPSEAKKYKKGLSPKQARTWAHIANSVLERCMKDGKSEAECAGAAIKQANGAVGAPRHAAQIWTNATLTVTPERTTLHNREFLKAPAVLLVAGVLNQGLIPGEVIDPRAWDGVPVVLNHPCDADGRAVSARSPDVLEDYGLGYVYNARLGTGTRNGQTVPSLVAELWLDVERLAVLGGEASTVMQRLEQQEMLEVSTAFYSDAVGMRGSFYGVPYDEVHYNLQPDHLAILPNSIGACSVEAGCGFPRLFEHTCACSDPSACTCPEEESPMTERPSVPRLQRLWQVLRELVMTPEEEPADGAASQEADAETEASAVEVVEDDAILATHQTDRDLRSALEGCLERERDAGEMPVWVESVDAVNQYFVYHYGPQLCRRYWEMVDGVVTLVPGVEYVQPVTDFVPVPDETEEELTEEEPPMAMEAPSLAVKTRVNRLIANTRSGWTEFDRSMLERLDEATLIRMENQPQIPVTESQREPDTLEEALEYIPSKFRVRETIGSAVRSYERHKAKLIEALIQNKQNPFAREELETFENERLEQLIVMAGEDLPDQQPRPLVQQQYNGRRVPQLRVVEDENEAVPPLPKTFERAVARQRELGLRA